MLVQNKWRQTTFISARLFTTWRSVYFCLMCQNENTQIRNSFHELFIFYFSSNPKMAICHHRFEFESKCVTRLGLEHIRMLIDNLLMIILVAQLSRRNHRLFDWRLFKHWIIHDRDVTKAYYSSIESHFSPRNFTVNSFFIFDQNFIRSSISPDCESSLN